MCQAFCSDESGFMDFDDFLDLVTIMSDRVSCNNDNSPD